MNIQFHLSGPKTENGEEYMVLYHLALLKVVTALVHWNTGSIIASELEVFARDGAVNLICQVWTVKLEVAAT